VEQDKRKETEEDKKMEHEEDKSKGFSLGIAIVLSVFYTIAKSKSSYLRASHVKPKKQNKTKQKSP